MNEKLQNAFIPEPNVNPEQDALFKPPVMGESEAESLSFNIATENLPAEVSETAVAPALPLVPVDSNTDFAAVQNNLKELIETGNRSLRDLYSLAKQTDHPRAYEVLTVLIQTVAQVNKDLLDIHAKKQRIDNAQSQGFIDNGTGAGKVVNNNVFVGSTTAFQRMLKSIREGDDDGVVSTQGQS